MTSASAYEGNELELFADATVWKRYWVGRIRRYIGQSVVEVGAGIGSNTRYLNSGVAPTWTCIEPDIDMSERLRLSVLGGTLPANVRVKRATLTEVAATLDADTIVYIDVLEHIADDRGEVATAAACLRSGGHLIVLAPAHQWLFSPFDRAIGHYRRYAKDQLIAIAVPGLSVVDAYYLDSVGFLASLVNRIALRSAMPTRAQIRFWDGVLVRASRVLDPILGYRFGKTVVIVWRRDA